MASLAANDIWTVIMASYNDDLVQAGINVVHYKVGVVAGTSVTDIAFAAAIDTIVAPLYKALMTDGAEWYGVKVVRKTPAPTDIPQVHVALTGDGTAGTDALPAAVSGLLKWNTGQIGRKGRGRIYVPFADAADNTVGAPIAGYVTRLQALGTALLNLITVGGGGNTAALQLCVVGKAVTAPAFPVTTATAEEVWATQHRRGGFGRLNPFPPISQ